MSRRSVQGKINQEQFEKLASIFCTRFEIADIFGVSIDTMERWCKKTYGLGYAVAIGKFSATGKAAIRRTQYVKGVHDKCTQMLKHLGVNYLDQKITPDIQVNNSTEHSNLIIKMNWDE